MARARQAVPGFDPDVADTALLEDVCRRLDGLPLAIELAAVRLRTLTLAQLQARLDDRFKLLTGGARTDRSPQRTLEAMVTWSYELLSPAEQATFRRVAVFPDSFDLEGAEAVASGGPVDSLDVLDLVAALVDKSLVTTVERAGAYRYQLLETLREYGRARLVEAGEEAAIRERLVGWAVGRADLVAAALRTPAQDATIAAVLVDRANITSAVECALAAGADDDALWIATMVPAMLHGDRREVIRRLLDEATSADGAVRGHALCALANIAIEQSDWAPPSPPGRRPRAPSSPPANSGTPRGRGSSRPRALGCRRPDVRRPLARGDDRDLPGPRGRVRARVCPLAVIAARARPGAC